MDKKNNLSKKIEQCREELITLSYTHSYTSEKMVKSSKRLDLLLNRYYKADKGA